MSEDCLFCKIICGDVPAEKVFENDKVIGFKDINPAAPIHILFVNKVHTKDISELVKTPALLTELLSAVTSYADTVPEIKGGYRLVINKGAEGGQSVFHTHVHLLGGKQLRGF